LRAFKEPDSISSSESTIRVCKEATLIWQAEEVIKSDRMLGRYAVLVDIILYKFLADYCPLSSVLMDARWIRK